ncbi:unnamed protein product [Darwinula stevensoni]|uniref:GCN5-related N-acetyltransferase Rv2170-like domain-containing protein n=1 Tax=Darwinula stevensoni TaxID=69355 RepID=A0A7R8XE70_9CRUS|nr:unnamed protein product [Darwinula stevensoni]CAG0895028.1 unnamed protein product [Darwinula stevensoni]
MTIDFKKLKADIVLFTIRFEKRLVTTKANMVEKVQLRPVEKHELKDLNDLLEPYLPENVAEKGASYELESHVEKLEYVWERGLALKWDGRIPDDMEIKPLSIEHAEIINDRWKYKDELVGWYVMHSHGSQGILHVTERHRGRGLASLLVRWVSRRVASAWGMLPYAIIDENNPASYTLFSKIGFRRLGSCQWIVCTPAAESTS